MVGDSVGAWWHIPHTNTFTFTHKKCLHSVPVSFFLCLGVCEEVIHWCCPWSPVVLIVMVLVGKQAANQAYVSTHTSPGTTGRATDTNRLSSFCSAGVVRRREGGRWGSGKRRKSRRCSQDLVGDEGQEREEEVKVELPKVAGGGVGILR